MLLRMLLLAPVRQSAAAIAKEGHDLGEAAHMCFVSSGDYEFADLQRSAHGTSNLLRYYSPAGHFARAKAQYNISKLFLRCAINEHAAKATNGESGAGTVIINSINIVVIPTSLTLNFDSLPLRMLASVHLRLLARTDEQRSRSPASACALGYQGHRRFWANGRLEISVFQRLCSSNAFQRFQRS